MVKRSMTLVGTRLKLVFARHDQRKSDKIEVSCRLRLPAPRQGCLSSRPEPIVGTTQNLSTYRNRRLITRSREVSYELIRVRLLRNSQYIYQDSQKMINYY